MRLTPSRRPLRCDFAFECFVGFVANEDEGEVFSVAGGGLAEKLLSPAVNGIKRLEVREVEHDDAALSALVERHSQALVPFLPRGIPNLRLASMFILATSQSDYRLSAPVSRSPPQSSACTES